MLVIEFRSSCLCGKHFVSPAPKEFLSFLSLPAFFFFFLLFLSLPHFLPYFSRQGLSLIGAPTSVSRAVQWPLGPACLPPQPRVTGLALSCLWALRDLNSPAIAFNTKPAFLFRWLAVFSFPGPSSALLIEKTSGSSAFFPSGVAAGVPQLWREGRGDLKHRGKADAKLRLCSAVCSAGGSGRKPASLEGMEPWGTGTPRVGLSHLAPSRHAPASCSLPFYSTEVRVAGRREGGCAAQR